VRALITLIVGALLGASFTWLVAVPRAVPRRADAGCTEELSAIANRLDALDARLAQPRPADAQRIDPNALRALVQSAVRDEASRRTTAPAQAPESAPRTAEQEASLERAHAVIREAIARHRWGSDDAAALRRELAMVDAAGRDQLLGELFPALNRRELRVDRGVSPL
jgi:hypothetical protein